MLRAACLLEGRVRYDGNSLRITARLIESASETQLWGESYTRKLSNYRGVTLGALSIQTAIASHIARSLALELMPSVVAPALSPALDVVTCESHLNEGYHTINWVRRDSTIAAYRGASSKAPRANCSLTAERRTGLILFSTGVLQFFAALVAARASFTLWRRRESLPSPERRSAYAETEAKGTMTAQPRSGNHEA
jgi:hypothetical protein